MEAVEWPLLCYTESAPQWYLSCPPALWAIRAEDPVTMKHGGIGTHVELEAAHALGADLSEEEQDAACVGLDQLVEFLLGPAQRVSTPIPFHFRSHSGSRYRRLD